MTTMEAAEHHACPRGAALPLRAIDELSARLLALSIPLRRDLCAARLATIDLRIGLHGLRVRHEVVPIIALTAIHWDLGVVDCVEVEQRGARHILRHLQHVPVEGPIPRQHCADAEVRADALQLRWQEVREHGTEARARGEDAAVVDAKFLLEGSGEVGGELHIVVAGAAIADRGILGGAAGRVLILRDVLGVADIRAARLAHIPTPHLILAIRHTVWLHHDELVIVRHLLELAVPLHVVAPAVKVEQYWNPFLPRVAIGQANLVLALVSSQQVIGVLLLNCATHICTSAQIRRDGTAAASRNGPGEEQ